MSDAPLILVAVASSLSLSLSLSLSYLTSMASSASMISLSHYTFSNGGNRLKINSSAVIAKASAICSTSTSWSFTLTLSNSFPKVPCSIWNSKLSTRRSLCSTQFCKATRNSGDVKKEDRGLDWSILKRWDVPWPWQTVSLTSLACGISFILTGLIENAAVPYLGLQITELSLDEKAELLFVDQAIVTAAVLGVLFSLTKSFQPLPNDLYKYDIREPFNLQKGWLLWAGIGIIGAVGVIALTGFVMSAFGETPERETDALIKLLPFIGSSGISTACLVGVTGILAPVLEETLFRGFFMVALTKWVPTPVAIVLSAGVFAAAHLTPGEIPQLFILGTILGLSYAQTRNLVTPITIHAFWNSGVILLLTFLQIQGYDIREVLQASSP